MPTDPVVGRTTRRRRAGRAALALGTGIGVAAAVALAWLGGNPTSPNDLADQGDFVASTPAAVTSVPSPPGFDWEIGGEIPGRRILAVSERQGTLLAHVVPLDERGLELFTSEDGSSWIPVERVISTQYVVSAVASVPDGYYIAAVHTESAGRGTFLDLAVTRSADGVTWSEPISLHRGDPVTQMNVAAGDQVAVVSVQIGGSEGDPPPEAVAALPAEWERALAEWPELTAIDITDALAVQGPLGLSLARFPYEELGFERERRPGPGRAVAWLSSTDGTWAQVELGERTSIGSGPIVNNGEVLAHIYKRGAQIISVTEAGTVATDIHASMDGRLLAWGERLLAVGQSYPSIRQWTVEGWTTMGSGRLLPLRSDYLTTGAVGGPGGLVVTVTQQPRISPEVRVEGPDGHALAVIPWSRVRVLDAAGDTILESSAEVWNSPRFSVDLTAAALEVIDESGSETVTSFALADLAAAEDRILRDRPRFSLFSRDGTDWSSPALVDGTPITPMLVTDAVVVAAEQMPELAFGRSPLEPRAVADSIQTWIGRLASGGTK